MKRTMTISVLVALALAVFAMSTLPAEAGEGPEWGSNWAISGEWSACFVRRSGANPNAGTKPKPESNCKSHAKSDAKSNPEPEFRRRARRRRRVRLRRQPRILQIP